MRQHVNLELMEFIEQQILPRYTAFGASHGLHHVTRVVKNALALAEITGADINMVYVIAAYHDLGMSGPRAIHHLTGGKILSTDARLKRWFSPEQIKIMKEAVEDHRASASRQPRSLYGKIVAEADRDLEPKEVFTRCLQYGLENYPEKNKEQQWERFAQHIEHKYAQSGYIKLWIPNSPNENNLKILRNIIEDEGKLRAAFEQIYQQLIVDGKA